MGTVAMGETMKRGIMVQRKPVLSRPPIGGTEAEKREWAASFARMILGPVEDDDHEVVDPELTETVEVIDVNNYDPEDYPGDIWPTDEMVAEAEWYASDVEDQE